MKNHGIRTQLKNGDKMSFLYVLGLAFLVLITGLIGNGNNNIAFVAACIFFPSAIALYFIPGIIASRRSHPNATSIFILNLLLGWSLVGWIIALIWAYGHIANVKEKTLEPIPEIEPKPPYPSDLVSPTKKLCPYCAEEIKIEAIVCRYCGRDIVKPEALIDNNQMIKAVPPSESELMSEFGITTDGKQYAFGDYKYDQLADAISYIKLQQKRQ